MGSNMTSPKPVSVNAVELRDAFDFVSMGAGLAEHSAYICLNTGRIYTHAEGTRK